MKQAMNKRQLQSFLIGILVAVLMILFPPFVLWGGILPGVRYSFFLHQPGYTDGDAYRTEKFVVLLYLQLGVVVLVTALTMLRHRKKLHSSTTSQKAADDKKVWPPPPNVL